MLEKSVTEELNNTVYHNSDGIHDMEKKESEEMSAEEKKALVKAIKEKVGRAVTVNTYIGPITPNGLTPTDLKREENARLSGVTDKTTMYGQLYEANRRLGDLEGLLQVYKEQLKEKDLAVHRAEELTKQNEILTKENQTLTQTNSQQVSTIQTLTESEATLTERIGRLEQTIRQLGGVIPN